MKKHFLEISVDICRVQKEIDSCLSHGSEYNANRKMAVQVKQFPKKIKSLSWHSLPCGLYSQEYNFKIFIYSEQFLMTKYLKMKKMAILHFLHQIEFYGI